MDRQLERQPDETVPEFAKRMSDLVNLINGIVQSHAGMLHDADDVIADLDFIIEHAGDDNWDECWKLRHDIDLIVSRMTSPTRLERVLIFAKEMSK